MSDLNNISAMIRLLEDEDLRIADHVYNEIKGLGAAALPHLVEHLPEAISAVHTNRILDLINEMKINKLTDEVQEWIDNGAKDLLEGSLIVSAFGYPQEDSTFVSELITEMTETIRKELPRYNPNPLDNIRIFNQIILKDYHFSGNTEDYTSTDNSYITRSMANRKGNPIMLCILYLLIAERLEIPLVGINSPRHFLLAYLDPSHHIISLSNEEKLESVLFYIDPFNKGQIYAKGNFDRMLKSVHFEESQRSSLISDNEMIIVRVLNNLIYGLNQKGETENAQNVMRMLNKLYNN